MKRHYWQYLIDSAGNAVEGAKISVLLAGTTTYANIQLTEGVTTYTTTEFTDILTDEKGFFEFWLSDLTTSPTNGYDVNQKFDIRFSKAGLTSGIIEDVQIIWAEGTAAGTTDITFTESGLTVPASSSVDFTLSDFLNRGLCSYLKIEETGGLVTGTYDVALCNDDTFTITPAGANYIAEAIDPASDYEDYEVFFVKDTTLAEKLFVRLTNNDVTNIAVFTITLQCEKFA
jgi:hypothetical protein